MARPTSGDQPIFRDGLKQVVERLHVEGAHGVFVVRRDEHDDRHVIGADLLQDVEAVLAWHLDVEQQEVRRMFGHRTDRRIAVCGFAHDLDVRMFGEQRSHPPTRERFVIDDERAHGVCTALHDADIR